MHYMTFWPNSGAMESAGFGYIAEVPAIFDENWRYHREASWYLRDRSKGEALPIDAESRTFPASSSLGQYAYKLADFLAWCDWARRSWKEVEYHRDLMKRYQKHMLEGDWAVNRGQKLAASTVNGRVDEAVWFCSWAARRGLRNPFNVQTRTAYRTNGGVRPNSYKPVPTETRTGKVRPDPIHLQIPQPTAVADWVHRFALERGKTKALMAELILRTAIRREEAAQWRVDYLPQDRNRWNVIGDYVSVHLKYGTKGEKSRYIDVPVEIAERLIQYQQVGRPKARMRYVMAGQSQDEQKRRFREIESRLFLSEHTGEPVTGKKLYEAWHEVSRPPVDQWSPHLGRHYWTCRTLLERHQDRIRLMGEGAAVSPDWATALARDDILMFVKPQLGHIDAATSEAYTVWLGKMIRSATANEEWIESLQSGYSEQDGQDI